MIIDNLLTFSNEQAVTSTGANASTNVIDLGANRDLGVSDDIYLEISVPVAVTSDGAATVDFQLQTDDNVSFSSATVLASTGAIGKATLVANYRPLRIRLPQVTERYLRINYAVGTAALTAGKFSAFLTNGRDTWRAYDAVTGV